MSLFKIAIYIGVLALLSGCGFEPVYESRAKPHVKAEMAAIKIGIIKDRIGQQLRNNLLDRLNPTGSPDSPNYLLDVTLKIKKEDTFFKKSKLSTRAILTLFADFRLNGKGRNLGKKFTGTSKILVSYNILSSHFATFTAEQNAKTRAVKELSADISNRIALFLGEPQHR